MKRLVTILLGLGALVASDPAFAAQVLDGPPIGSRLGSRVRPDPIKDERLAALAAHEMASCLVNKKSRHVAALLASTTAEAADTARKKISGEITCLSAEYGNDLVEGRGFSYPPDVLRGMLAEHSLKSKRLELARLAPLPRQRIYARPYFTATKRHVAVDEMAICVSETDPANTVALFATAPYSAEERQAFKALMPAMGPCLSAGAKLQANRQALRAALADALYQRLQPGSTGTSK